MGEKQYQSEPERTKPSFYDELYPRLLETAQHHGYTLAIHGSIVRDFELVAVPRTEGATTADKLICDIAVVHTNDNELWKDAAERAVASKSEKPHGRIAYTVLLRRGGPRLNISVMPTTGPAPRSDQS